MKWIEMEDENVLDHNGDVPFTAGDDTMLTSGENGDCPICLDPMSVEDVKHVLQCRRRCRYNFCMDCIESFISSSRDDYMEASDGNMHVKVFLNCPNCRSDLSTTIRDTLLLRKTDRVKRLAHQGSQSKFTESQRRLAKALRTEKVEEAVHQARKAEDIYLGTNNAYELRRLSSWNDRAFDVTANLNKEDIDLLGTDDDEFDGEEWGVECDIDIGVHQSFRMPRVLPPDDDFVERLRPLEIDSTLFAGLDFCLDDSQRKSITTQMTSGNLDHLSSAAFDLFQALHSIQNPAEPNLSQLTVRNKKTFNKQSSVFELIEESKATKAKQEMSKDDLYALLQIPQHSALLAEHRRLGREKKAQAKFLKQFPLPVRMPKSIEITVDDVNTGGMKFIDYSWDGTVMDAFRKINISVFQKRVSQKKPTSNKGVQRILDNMGNVQVALPGQPRILIQDAGPAGKQGANRGDIVTHIDGVAIDNYVTDADRLLSQLQSKTPGQPFFITLNAERSVAEALKRRAIAIAEELSMGDDSSLCEDSECLSPVPSLFSCN